MPDQPPSEFDINKVAAQLTKLYTDDFLERLGNLLSSTKDGIAKTLRTTIPRYLQSAIFQYARAKTIIYRDSARPIHTFFVPLDLTYDDQTLTDVSSQSIWNKSNHTVVTGTGGSGKSMLLRSLFVDAAICGKTVPIFIELRDLNKIENSLIELIIISTQNHQLGYDTDSLEKGFKEGLFSLFLDGLDEVSLDRQNRVRDEIMDLSKKFPRLNLIVTSRPDDDFVSWTTFAEAKVAPLTKTKAIALINKLEYDPSQKDAFKAALTKSLFESHQSFLSNPLLLTIMFLTHDNVGDIPRKRHLFYQNVFETLWYRHDTLKGRNFSRPRHTDLASDDFFRVLSVVGVHTYLQQIYTFPANVLRYAADKAKSIYGLQFESPAFIRDAVSFVCIFVQDGLDYSFAHRSFQEYFVAAFYSTCEREVREKLTSTIFDRSNEDTVVDLIYEMNQRLCEETILLPILRDARDLTLGLDASTDEELAEPLARLFYYANRSIDGHGSWGIEASFRRASVLGRRILADELEAWNSSPERASLNLKPLFDGDKEHLPFSHEIQMERQATFEERVSAFSKVGRRVILELQTPFGINLREATHFFDYAIKKIERSHVERVDSIDDLFPS